MAITELLTIPNQPNAGTLQYIALGGDGWVAPQSAWYMDMRITGDASGGRITATVSRDERFEHLVSFLRFQQASATAVDYIFELRRVAGIEIQQLGVAPVSGIGGVTLSTLLWSPPAVIDPVSWTLTVDNVDGELVRFGFMIYNFNIRASEKVPLDILLSSLIRSPSAI